MKVSVIIPVYQVEAYVQECLESVQTQSLEELEIICVHDAGEDGSWEIVKQAAAGDSRIRLLENERNLGLAATRNRGLAQARGKYVYFLDSDDKIRRDALEVLYRRAEREELEVQIFAASFLYENEELKEKFCSNPSQFKGEYPQVMEGRRLFAAWMKVWDWMPSQPRYFYRREFLEKHGLRFPEGMLHEDETFTFDVLMYARRVLVTNEEFFIRRFRSASIMTGVPTIRNVEGCVCILEHIASMQEWYLYDQELNQAVKYYMYKIFCDVCRKYQRASQALETGETLLGQVSQEMLGDPARMAVYHLLEAVSLWRET